MRQNYHYEKIVERLKGEVDPRKFEDCAVDLLTDLYPHLVPIRGGNDFGYDGKDNDPLGESRPLVSTTSRNNYKANLEHSLKRVRERDQAVSSAIFATSVFLTADERRKLEDAASDLDFCDLRIHDGEDFASRLFTNSAWSKALLNVTGAPRTLTISPPRNRPVLLDQLIGREKIVDAITSVKGDIILYGQPGVGKTAVLREVAKTHNAIFVVVRDDLTRLADDIREHSPHILIVDDAHDEPEFLDTLRHVRSETSADFKIIASCWPDALSKLKTHLDVSGDAIVCCALLPMPLITEIVRLCGLDDRKNRSARIWVEEILRQSQGKPGIAATLAHHALRRNRQEVASGKVLMEELQRYVEPMTVQLLGRISLGGALGLSIEKLSEVLNESPRSIQAELTRLAVAGVITSAKDHGAQRVIVEPRPLRETLVKEVFYGQCPVGIDEILRICPDDNQTTLTLVGAVHRGAEISHQLLKKRVLRASSKDVWRSYAQLGASESEWLLSNQPECLVPCGPILLNNSPEATINLIFERCDRDKSTRGIDYYFSIIDNWIKDPHPKYTNSVQRREMLLNKSSNWASTGRDPEIAVRALMCSVSLKLELTQLATGNPRVFESWNGMLLREQVESVGGFWTRIWKALEALREFDRHTVLKQIENWVYPQSLCLGHQDRDTAKQSIDAARSFAGEQLQQLVRLSPDSPGLVSRCREFAEALNYELSTIDVSEYEALFPRRDLHSHQHEKIVFSQQAESIGTTWSRLPSHEVAATISKYEAQCRTYRSYWMGYSLCTYHALAKAVAHTEEWIDALIGANCPTQSLEPFFERLAQGNRSHPEIGLSVN